MSCVSVVKTMLELSRPRPTTSLPISKWVGPPQGTYQYQLDLFFVRSLWTGIPLFDYLSTIWDSLLQPLSLLSIVIANNFVLKFSLTWAWICMTWGIYTIFNLRHNILRHLADGHCHAGDLLMNPCLIHAQKERLCWVLDSMKNAMLAGSTSNPPLNGNAGIISLIEAGQQSELLFFCKASFSFRVRTSSVLHRAGCDTQFRNKRLSQQAKQQTWSFGNFFFWQVWGHDQQSSKPPPLLDPLRTTLLRYWFDEKCNAHSRVKHLVSFYRPKIHYRPQESGAISRHGRKCPLPGVLWMMVDGGARSIRALWITPKKPYTSPTATKPYPA